MQTAYGSKSSHGGLVAADRAAASEDAVVCGSVWRSSLADAADAAVAPRASRRWVAPKEFLRRCVAPPSLLIKSRRRAAERGAAVLLPLLTRPAPLLPFECVMRVGSLEEKKGTCGHSVAAIIVLLSPLDCIEAICAFAKLGVAALLPLPMPLTLRHSSSASRGCAASEVESCSESVSAIRRAATNARALEAALPPPSGAPPSPPIRLRC